MSQEQLILLQRIYNTLMLVSTKGEDTMTMADCLSAMQNLIEQLKQQQQPERTVAE